MAPRMEVNGKPKGRWLGDDRGSIAPITAALLLLLIGIAGLVIDGGNLYSIANRLQAAADAAALAGASKLGSPEGEDAVIEQARLFAQKNLPRPEHGIVLKDTDVRLGTWNATARTFTETNGPDAPAPNAVKVTLKRNADNANPVRTLFAAAIGVPNAGLSASSIAVGSTGGPETGTTPSTECSFADGIFANGTVSVRNANVFAEGFCVFGQDWVHLSTGNVFPAGAIVGRSPSGLFSQGGRNSIASGSDRTLAAEAPLSPYVRDLIATLRSGRQLPSFITAIERVSALPPTLIEGTAYVVAAPVKVPPKQILRDVAIVGSGPIEVGADTTLRNVVLASDAGIHISGNALDRGQIGDADYCATGDGTVQLLSAGDIAIGDGRNMFGVQMIARNSIAIGSNRDNGALSIQAGNHFSMQSRGRMGVCPTHRTEHVRFRTAGPASITLRLVR